MKGSIVSAAEGDIDAAQLAKTTPTPDLRGHQAGIVGRAALLIDEPEQSRRRPPTPLRRLTANGSAVAAQFSGGFRFAEPGVWCPLLIDEPQHQGGLDVRCS
jgi:hypothetical protein